MWLMFFRKHGNKIINVVRGSRYNANAIPMKTKREKMACDQEKNFYGKNENWNQSVRLQHHLIKSHLFI